MKIGIVGGGINGLCAAWQLAVAGYEVSLFERGELLGETSTASSKLLHGGIRYLENLEFRLVKEALVERAWWLEHVPVYTQKLKLCLPIYSDSQRASWKLKLGLSLYDVLAGSKNIGKHALVSPDLVDITCPMLKKKGLQHLYTFFDGQMDERLLGTWVAKKATEAGAILFEHKEVLSLDIKGVLNFSDTSEKFDAIINLTGPWGCQLLNESEIKSSYELDLVKGSHIILNRQVHEGYLLEVPNERRIFFVLPYQEKTLVGTTEVRHTLGEPIQCSFAEKSYLLGAYNHYFGNTANDSDIVSTFAGIRPLIKSSHDPSRATREYAIERNGHLINVFGGKWTTSRALAKKIVKEVSHGFH